MASGDRCLSEHLEGTGRDGAGRGRIDSYSFENGGCVEVAPAPDGVLVRDCKDRDGPALTVPTTAWQAFLTTVTR